MHASGHFEVTMSPQPADDDSGLGRMRIDKQFHGDLQARSQGQMLAAGTEVKGSAGYVAMERVEGSLQGRSGSFILQHSGTMDRGVPQLLVSVVPDSGTGELRGLAGTLTIDIVEGRHRYGFEYRFAETP